MSDSRPAIAASLAGLDGDPREEMERLALLGFAGVQLSATRLGLRPRDLDGSGRRALRALLRHHEFALTGIDLWIPPAHFLDAAQVSRAVEAVESTIELAADCGRVPISLALPVNAPSDGAKGDAAQATAVSERSQIVDALAQRAERFGVVLVDHSVTDSSTAANPLWRAGVDPAAWLAKGLDPNSGVSRLGAKLGAVRLVDLTISGMRAAIADPDCGPAASEAQLDPLAFAMAIAVLGRPIPVVADPRQWSDPWTGLAQTIEVWRRAMAFGTR